MTPVVLLMTSLAGATDWSTPVKQGHPTRALLLGGSGEGHWNAGLSVGSPWVTATTQVGLRGGWTPIVEVQSASFARWQPAVGVGKRWIDRSWRLTGESVLGWTLQGEPVPFRGPAAELRMKGGRAVGRFVPYAHVGLRSSRTIDHTEDTSGEVLRSSIRWETSFSGAVGTGLALGDRIGVDVGADLPWIDVPNPSLPGLHVGVHGGWGRTQ